MNSGLADDRSDDEGDGDGEDEAPEVEETPEKVVKGHANGSPKLPDLAVNGQPVDAEAEVIQTASTQDRKATLRKR